MLLGHVIQGPSRPPHPTLEWEHSSLVTSSSACSRGAGWASCTSGSTIACDDRQPSRCSHRNSPGIQYFAADSYANARYRSPSTIRTSSRCMTPVSSATSVHAMRYVEGQDLRALLASEGTLSAEQTIAIVGQIHRLSITRIRVASSTAMSSQQTCSSAATRRPTATSATSVCPHSGRRRPPTWRA